MLRNLNKTVIRNKLTPGQTALIIVSLIAYFTLVFLIVILIYRSR